MRFRLLQQALQGACTRLSTAAIAVCLAVLTMLGPAAAQTPPFLPNTSGSAPGATVPELPEDLSPDMVDGMLARLTDAEIRALLRDELRTRAEEREAAAASAPSGFDAVQSRLAEAWSRISRNVSNRAAQLGRLDARGPQIERRLAMAENGVTAMILAAIALVAAGVAAAYATH
ncbi:MAG: hypothetical protein AAFW46_17865 [Pseudomonadota bacterium]